jgi:hypothetical protein
LLYAKDNKPFDLLCGLLLQEYEMKTSYNSSTIILHTVSQAVFFIFVCSSLSFAGSSPVVHVKIETENHVGTPHTIKENIFRRVKLTYHIPASGSEKPVSISVRPWSEAGLVVEHIAIDGTVRRQTLPYTDAWRANSETVDIRAEKSRDLLAHVAVWVNLGMHLDFSKPGIYHISYQNPAQIPSTNPDDPTYTSDTLVIACVTLKRYDQLHQKLRQNQALALASYQFKNPPCVECPKYRRGEYLNKIQPAIKAGTKQDEVLLLLGSPDSVYYASPGVRKLDGWNERWSYETSPVGGFSVCFKDRCVVRAGRHHDSPHPPRQ